MTSPVSLGRFLLLVALGAGTLIGMVPRGAAQKGDRAARPARLGRNARAGIEYLVRQQQADGGWNAGDIPGQPQFPARATTDVVSTSIAALALVRAGVTPRQGKYARCLQRAVAHVCAAVEKADDKSLFVSPGRGSLAQVKLHPALDTFLAALLLAEVNGRMPNAHGNKRVRAALEKVVAKMAANQQDDGSWSGKASTPMLGQALASRALNRARQAGVAVDTEKLELAANRARGLVKRVAAASEAEVKAAPALMLYDGASGIGELHDALQTSRSLASARTIRDSPGSRGKGTTSRLTEAEKVFGEQARKIADRAGVAALARGHGLDSSEEYLCFMLVGEALRTANRKQWEAWERTTSQRIARNQFRDGSWVGRHCVTGRTFCTAAAVLALLTDRSPDPSAAREK